jgi:hypothetical protein
LVAEHGPFARGEDRCKPAAFLSEWHVANGIDPTMKAVKRTGAQPFPDLTVGET